MTNNLHSSTPFRVVAIDGGAASGKSSTSRRLAEQCHWLHVDTGSHYRAVAFAAIQAGLSPEDSSTFRSFIDSLSFSSRIAGRESLVCFDDGEPPRQEDIRSEAVNRTVSPLAALPFVRQSVKAYQRSQVELARGSGFNGIVMDGRDIGTVILPHADLKIFLQADPQTRQQRRYLEGATDTISDRDKRDSTRKIAPLVPAKDAVLIDNSNLSLEEVVQLILSFLPDQLTS